MASSFRVILHRSSILLAVSYRDCHNWSVIIGVSTGRLKVFLFCVFMTISFLYLGATFSKLVKLTCAFVEDLVDLGLSTIGNPLIN